MPFRERVAGGLGAAATVALVGAALVYGLAVPAVTRPVQQALAVLDLAEPPPPPEKPPEPPRPSRAAKHAPAPPNLRNRASGVVVPPPVIRLPPPPPTVTAAPVAGPGFAANAGASDRPGPGTGAGGRGNGTGGGGDGDGTGDVGPVQVAGNLSSSDLPESLKEQGVREASLTIAYRVETSGRISACEIDRSSGYPELDERACTVAKRYFRYRPARLASGAPFAAWSVSRYYWRIDRAAE